MKKFKFKLEKLLDINIKEEDESKLKYTQAQNEKRIVEKNLERLEENYKKYSDITRANDVISQKVTINYLSTLTQSIKLTDEKLKEEEKKVIEAQNDLIQKQIKRKSLEILKEKEMERVRKEEERIEQIRNDEFALYAYIRNNANVSQKGGKYGI
ncbi:flagellar export protein FliJ [Terrisporobacter petrolearius]|uniref:flagellar export protein FliJ n=1 Tax=Terrisporobacter petrolearius TaxID=1460447 RepID=UPI001D16D4D8|nr:flagellar export protein FliJ [Terrisporobacter petrolearius]MCC3862850.1 flagellar export protein FliJ [Terrisporobacter petrolearius]